MSGISMMTALEIVTNPKDLQILLTQDKVNGKYAIVIYRGPGHNFKLLISSIPYFEKIDSALDEV